MTAEVFLILATGAVNGAITWGVVTTKLAWMRRDIDHLSERLLFLEREAREA